MENILTIRGATVLTVRKILTKQVRKEDNQMDENISINLYDADNQPIPFQIKKTFSIGKEEQLYCAAMPKKGGDIVFLKCAISEDNLFTVEDILDEEEYKRVSDYYMGEEEQQDYITAMDNGKEVTFLVHAIFEDERNHRSYIALQKMESKEKLADKLSLYRLRVDENGMSIDQIASDMEFERVKELYKKLQNDA